MVSFEKIALDLIIYPSLLWFSTLGIKKKEGLPKFPASVLKKSLQIPEFSHGLLFKLGFNDFPSHLENMEINLALLPFPSPKS